MLIKTSQDTEEGQGKAKGLLSSISATCCEVGTWWRLIIPSRSEMSIQRLKKVNLPEKCPCSARAMHLKCYWVDAHCQKRRFAANIHLNWTSCAQAQVPIRSAAENDIAIIRTLSSACEIALCMKNKYSCKSSCHHPSWYRRMSKSGKVCNFSSMLLWHTT